MKKQILVEAAIGVLKGKINNFKAEILSLQDSMNADGKSTVGDKHETNRAMIQNEIEQMGKSLSTHEQHLTMFSGIDFEYPYDSVESGAFVITSKFQLFMGVALGKVTIEGQDVQFISMESPIAQALLKKKAGEEIEFNGNTIKILEIY